MNTAPKKDLNPDFFANFQSSSDSSSSPKPTFQAYQPSAQSSSSDQFGQLDQLPARPAMQSVAGGDLSNSDSSLPKPDKQESLPPTDNPKQLPPADDPQLPSPHTLALPPADELRLPATSSVPKHSKPWLMILITISSLILTTYFALHNLALRSEINSLKQTQQALDKNTSAQSAKLKEYTNTQFNLSLTFPETTTFDVTSIPGSDELQLIFNQQQPDQFSLTALKDYQPQDVAFLFNTAPTSRRVVASKLWDIYSIANYQESSDQDPMDIFALRLEQGNILYTFIFPNQTDTTGAQDAIISSIEFTTASATSSAEIATPSAQPNQ